MTACDILATTNGPLHVRGPVRLQRKDGTVIADVADETWLCRCGQSADKPFCDDSHARCGFTDHPDRAWTGTPGTAEGPPRITVRRNGPYFVEGAVVVRNEAGTVLAAGSRIVLCRCGASRTKPFCDGSHRTSQFLAD